MSKIDYSQMNESLVDIMTSEEKKSLRARLSVKLQGAYIRDDYDLLCVMNYISDKYGVDGVEAVDCVRMQDVRYGD